MKWTPEQYKEFINKKLSKRKYNNTPKEYNGVKYQSTKEANYAKDLDLLKRAGAIADWDSQYEFKFYAYGELICSYKIDFRIHHNDSNVEYVEIKGGNATKTSTWRIKWKFTKAYLKIHEPKAKLTLIDK